jgi:hypothetical protein
LSVPLILGLLTAVAALIGSAVPRFRRR